MAFRAELQQTIENSETNTGELSASEKPKEAETKQEETVEISVNKLAELTELLKEMSKIDNLGHSHSLT